MKNSVQSGIALPLTLILLFVMTLLGVASLRTTMLEEKMASNVRMREVAFNAAEATLRDAERHAEDIKEDIRTLIFRDGIEVDANGRDPGNDCEQGYCIPRQFQPDANSNPRPEFERWADRNLDVWNDNTKHRTLTNYQAINIETDGVFEAPKYIIEFLGHVEPFDTTVGDYVSNCPPPSASSSIPPDITQWPYCPDDPAIFRITATAKAGTPGQEATVLLQSTVQVP